MPKRTRAGDPEKGPTGEPHSCAHCGACEKHDRCDHCGYCRKCGIYVMLPPQLAHIIWPNWPAYPQPYYPQPYTITWGSTAPVTTTQTSVANADAYIYAAARSHIPGIATCGYVDSNPPQLSFTGQAQCSGAQQIGPD